MIWILKGRAKITSYEMVECDVCHSIYEKEFEDAAHLTEEMEAGTAKEAINKWYQTRDELPKQDGVQRFLDKWLIEPVATEISIEQINRRLGAPELLIVPEQTEKEKVLAIDKKNKRLQEVSKLCQAT